MFRRIAIAGMLGASFTVPPASAVEITECALMLEDDAARLACYDRVAMAELKRRAGGTDTGAATPVPASPATAAAKPAEDPWAGKPYVPAVAAVPPKPATKTYKRIDVTDVMATPGKWVDRDIEFASANVYWVADDDLRILTSINMTLFGRAATGTPADLAYLKENCETAKEAQSSKCRIRVRFAYSDHSEDKPNGFSKRTVLVAPTVELVRLQSSGRRR